MDVVECSFVFFFKQKTAYEIYQCDWSSDVCSSDLGKALFHTVVAWEDDFTGHVVGYGTYPDQQRDIFKIGRASCRERV